MTTTPDEFSLDAKYTLERGRVYLSGIQALVRLPFDQHRADRARGLNTATFISGYRGSPLGGLDQTLERNPKLLAEHNVVFSSGLNEDLAATAVFGSQMVGLFPRPKYDGVLGMWYGKAPGVDRSGDAFKHANYAGIGKNGGVLALVGDDPVSKSSTLPSHSEVALWDALIPTIYPGNVQEILDMGLHGFMLSRISGLWVAMKIVTNVADEAGTAEVDPDRVRPVIPTVELDGRPYQHAINVNLIPPYGLDMERTLHYARLELARRYAWENKLDKIMVPTPDAWLGILTTGKTYYDVRQALHELGLGRGGAAPLRRAHPQDGDALADGAAHHPRVRPRARGDPGRRGEARIPRAVRQGRAVRLARAPARRRQVRRGRAPAARHRGRARLGPDRAGHRQAPRAQGSDRARRGAHPAPRRDEAAPQALHDRPHGVLLLGLPAQPLDGRARGQRRRRGHRLSRHGHGHGSRDHRRHPHGRRGRAVGGRRALHGDAAPLPEHRRRDVLSLGGPRAQLRGGVRRQYHLQDPLQLGGGHDRRPDRGGGARHPAADAAPRGRGGQADHPHHRRSRQVQGRRARREHASVAPRPPHRGPVGAGLRPRRHRAPARPAVRRGEAAAAQARQAGRARPARLHQRARVRGVRGLRREVELPERPARRHGVRTEDADPPVLLQQGLLVPARRLPVLPHHRARGPAQEEGAAPHAARRGAAGARAQGARGGLRRAHDGHRRHRRGHREPDPGHGGDARRQARAGPRSDRAQPEGRAGGLGPQDRLAAARSGQQDLDRRRRPLPGVRPPRGHRPEQSGQGGIGPHHRRRVDEPDPHRPDGAGHRRALPRAERHVDGHRPRHAEGSQRVPRRARHGGGALRRPHGDQPHPDGRRVSDGGAADLGRVHRARDPAQRGVRGDESPRVPVGADGRRGRRRASRPRRSGPPAGWSRTACCPPRRGPSSTRPG